MSREIKFRAYGIFGFPGICNKAKMNYFSLFDKVPSIGENVPVMQFTGLQDKNGKDIFESDIVEYDEINGTKEILIVEWSDNEVGWRTYLRKPHVLYGSLNGKVRVIGGIHENPELLESN